MKDLTKAEEQVMHVLWKLKKGFVNDILEKFPEPKPAYNTVSTIVRILEKKGYISHKAYGKTHEYFPAISKEAYTKDFMGGFIKDYFNSSVKQMVSFFTKDNSLTIKEMDEIIKLIEDEKLKNKK